MRRMGTFGHYSAMLAGGVSPCARRMPAGRTQAGNAITTQAPASNALAGYACSGKE